ncbi:protein ANKUB1-like [Aplochiton taeniatus]
MGTVFLMEASVTRLKSLVSLECGLPVSAFRLSMLSGVPLFDCNRLHDYAIEVGVTLRLDPWDGWVPFLHGCFLGHSLTVQRHLSKERAVMRFQLRVALFVAAYLGHLDLAGWLLKRGLRAEEPVGVHPYRQWCYQTAHPEAVKCPVHTAAEQGHLLILKLFISSCVLNLTCLDPQGRYPLKLAIQYGHRDCVRYLSTKLCSVVTLPYLTLPMNIYLQIKRWARLGGDRAASKRCQWHRAPIRARVGDTVLVDGYTQPNKVPLPPISCESNPRPLFISSSPTTSHILTASLESFSRQCGRTPRQNAIYCLTMASSFTERPWLQQLNVARTLAKRTVQRLET